MSLTNQVFHHVREHGMPMSKMLCHEGAAMEAAERLVGGRSISMPFLHTFVENAPGMLI